MSGESFPNTPNIDQGQSGPDDGGYSAAMESGDSEQVAAAMDAVAQATDLRDIPSSHVTEGTEFGVNADLEAVADKILAEADAKEASASAQEAPAAPAPITAEAPTPEVAAAAPAVESPAPTPAAAETPATQPAAEAPAAIAPEDTNIDLAQSHPEATSREKERDFTLPDGTHFHGTPEAFNQAVQDYLANIRDLM